MEPIDKNPTSAKGEAKRKPIKAKVSGEDKEPKKVPLKHPVTSELKRDPELIPTGDGAIDRQNVIWMVIGVIVLFMLAGASWDLVRVKENITDDMRAAMVEARKTFPYFEAAFQKPRLDQNYFSVKVPYEDKGELKHVWLNDLSVKDDMVHGRLERKITAHVEQNRLIAELAVPVDEISDWMIIEGDVLLGGYTTRQSILEMPETMRTQWVAERSYRILEDRILPAPKSTPAEEAPVEQ